MEEAVILKEREESLERRRSSRRRSCATPRVGVGVVDDHHLKTVVKMPSLEVLLLS